MTESTVSRRILGGRSQGRERQHGDTRYRLFFHHPEMLAEMLLLFSQGCPPADLSRKYTCDHSTIIHQGKKNGIIQTPEIRTAWRLRIREKKKLLVLEGERAYQEREAQLERERIEANRSRYQEILERPVNHGNTYEGYLKIEESRHKIYLTPSIHYVKRDKSEPQE